MNALGRPLDAERLADSAPAFSDEALALQFANRHAGDLRFVAAWNKWLVWDGKHWEFEETLRAWDFAREICREAAAQCNKAKLAPAIASAKTIYAVERLARSDRRLAAVIDQWDADPWLLNTPDGVIDLRTGQRRPHRADDYQTKITAGGPRGDCPRFLAFLTRITGGDGELIAYLQRVFGYALTGVTREHALFFGHGSGANGKSVLLSTVSGVLGDYHKTAPLEAFIATNGDRIPNDIAGLRGARLVTATETEEGRRWAEAKIKSLTGGDKIAARFMRAEWFEFLPAFKLVIAGNHKPSLRSVDESIRRRFHLIPFAVTVPEGERGRESWRGSLRAVWNGRQKDFVSRRQFAKQQTLTSPPKILSPLGSMRLASASRQHGNRPTRCSDRGPIGQTPQASILEAPNAFPWLSKPAAFSTVAADPSLEPTPFGALMD
jgi:putative DNA primase/helicase